MRTSSGHMLLVAVLFGLFLSACGGGKDEIAPSSVDTTAPTVIATSPVNGVRLGPSHTTITATFSEDMNPATLTTAAFVVSVDGKPVTGAVSYTYKTVVFTPEKDLDLDKLYTVTITADAKDAAGNALAAPYTWSFTPGVALLESDDAGDAVAPRIAMDANGNAIAVWQQWDSVDRYWKIMARRSAGGVWDAVATPVNTGKGDARSPQIAMAASGDAWVVWQQHDPSAAISNIWASRYDASSEAWVGSTLIKTKNANTTGTLVNAYTPQIAVNASGQAIIVWRQLESEVGYDVWSVVASRYVGGVWSDPVWLEQNNLKGLDAEQPYVAMDDSGNAVVIWQQAMGAYANRYNVASSSWGSAMLVGDAGILQIPINTTGDAVAVWRLFDGIWANRTGAALIETHNAGDANELSVSINGNGDAIAVWRQYDGAHWNVWYNRYNATAGSWNAAALVEENDAGDAYDPHAVIDNNGRVISVWRQRSGSRWSIWQRRF